SGGGGGNLDPAADQLASDRVTRSMKKLRVEENKDEHDNKDFVHVFYNDFSYDMLTEYIDYILYTYVFLIPFLLMNNSNQMVAFHSEKKNRCGRD
ncbi:unnamed protein product, partial [Rotaria sp. Silwood1]